MTPIVVIARLTRIKGQQVWTGDRSLELSAARLRAYAAALSRFRLLLLAWIILWGGVGFAYVTLVEPKFVAQADIYIEPRRIASDGPEDLRHFHQLALDSEQADTELRVLMSEVVLRPVFDDLQLTQTVELESGRDGFWSSVAHWLHGMAPGSTRYDVQQRAYYAFVDRVRCLRLGLSYVFEVSYRSTNSTRAAQVVNAVAASYLSDRLLRLSAHFNNIGGAYRVARENAVAEQIEASRIAIRNGLGLDQDLFFANARLLGSATAPLSKSYPKTGLMILLACGFGVISGVLLILVFGTRASLRQRLPIIIDQRRIASNR